LILHYIFCYNQVEKSHPKGGKLLERTFAEYVGVINGLFERSFADAYRMTTSRKKRRLMQYIGALHRRWYYSNLIENTSFSPANIMDSLAAHFSEDEPVFRVALKSEARFTGFDIQIIPGGAKHPIIADLRRVAEYCLPHADIHEGDIFYEGQLLELIEDLSICDPAYPSFLLDLALKMKLLTKLPSVHINRIEAAQDYETRLDGEFIFDEIVNAAIAVCAYNLRELVALPEVLFTDSYVRAMLTEPLETDAVFEQVYESIGYTLDDLVSFAENAGELDFDTEEGAFLAGTFMMGIVLDQHFFTPFGYYLKLIKPMYVLPFEFENEIKEFFEGATFTNDQVYIAFFAPCSSYTLTKLGLECFKVKPNEENFIDTALHLPFDSYKEMFFGDPDMVNIMLHMAKMFPPTEGGFAPVSDIYAFRVRMEPALWLDVHMPSHATLDDFFEEICDCFPLRESEEYSFFHSAEESPFSEYPSPKRAKKNAKKRSSARLESIDFDHEKQMILAVHAQALPFSGAAPTVRLTIEMRGTPEKVKGRGYPWVSRISKALKAQIEATWKEDEE
jgi:hypothetical protein